MLKQVVEAYELLDSAYASGKEVVELLRSKGVENAESKIIRGKKGSTDFVRATFRGEKGKISGGVAPTLGIIGMLGGVGGRPLIKGLVSDGDGAILALAVGLKLADMDRHGDPLEGDVIVTTHICPNAPILPRKPVPFMGSPVGIKRIREAVVCPEMDAILSVDTTKGNRVINHRGFAITPTVKEGWILRVSEDLLTLMEVVTGSSPAVVPITMQDITPYGNDVYHLNSMMQPSVVTPSPVVGVAITSETQIPGSAGGATNVVDLEQAGRFCIEAAKRFGSGSLSFYDEREFEHLVSLYGSMGRLQKFGRLQKIRGEG
jgi:hypothetical protein